MKPKARHENIVVLETNGETLIYDLNLDQAFLLNGTSAFVWNQCNGQNDVPQIAKALAQKHKQPINEDIIWLAINDLEKTTLLTETVKSNNPWRELSRRELVKKVGLTTMIALPVISSLVAPMAAKAASSICLPDSPGCVAAGNSYSSPQPNADACFRPPAFARCCSCFFSLAGYEPPSGMCLITCR